MEYFSSGSYPDIHFSRATILLCCLLSACGGSICLLSACGGSIVLCEKMQLFHDILSNFDQQRDRVVRS